MWQPGHSVCAGSVLQRGDSSPCWLLSLPCLSPRDSAAVLCLLWWLWYLQEGSDLGTGVTRCRMEEGLGDGVEDELRSI